jgi:hypothetical protein
MAHRVRVPVSPFAERKGIPVSPFAERKTWFWGHHAYLRAIPFGRPSAQITPRLAVDNCALCPRNPRTEEAVRVRRKKSRIPVCR